MTARDDRISATASSADLLRASGLRATGPRLLILDALSRDTTHPTPERLHESLRRRHRSLSLSTVYQTLEAFARVGLCRRVNAAGGRLRVDGTPRDHDHAVCRECGRIDDVARTGALPREKVEELPSGWTLIDVHVEYEVVCGNCARARAAGD